MLIINFRYGVSDYAAAALANALLKDFGIITNTDRVEVIDSSKISREKRRIGATSVIDREQDILKLQCIGLDSKKDANVPEPVVIDTIVKWVLKKVLSINVNFFSGDH
jgi:DNA integrity scanning protein DisA with diadenylate cyclase activity